MMTQNYRKRWFYFFFIFNLISIRFLMAAAGTLILTRRNSESSGEPSEPGLNISYVSPLPGSEYVTASTNIIIRANDVVDESTLNSNAFSVYGSVSGVHDGKVVLSDDKKTFIFLPYAPFTGGEIVTVQLHNGIKTLNGENISLNPLTFNISKGDLNSFYKSEPAKEFNNVELLQSESNAVNSANTKSLSKLNDITIDTSEYPSDLPFVTMDSSNNPTDGYLFISTMNGITTRNMGNYNMIIDNSGVPHYYGYVGKKFGTDFKIQPDGTLSYYDQANLEYYIMNTSMHIIDSVTCGNGYITDIHELRVLPDGHMFLLGDDYETVDMSQIVTGGNPGATVMGIILQELDKNKNVVFQWRSWDHYQITDATHENLQAATIDYVHANAVEIDTDGNLLLSARHLDEITKINSSTGETIWRLGGKNNQFTFTNDTIGFSHQHAIRMLPNGHLIFFDNGNFHTPSFSRAVEYNLDEEAKTATLVWQYRNNPDIYGSAMGYVQRLANGNTMIGWGQAATSITEVTPEGNIVLQMSLPVSDWNYRVYRLPFVFIKGPLNGDNIQPNSTTEIKWECEAVDSVDVDYSTDGGTSWNNIVKNYPGNLDSLAWNVPDISSANCKIRITESGQMDMGDVFESDSAFSISNVSGIKTATPVYSYKLNNNYPNPFNPSTVINYSLAENSKVSIKIYNIIGQLVKQLVNNEQGAGVHEVSFNAVNLPSGVYFDAMNAVSLDGKKQYSSVHKMILIK